MKPLECIYKKGTIEMKFSIMTSLEPNRLCICISSKESEDMWMGSNIGLSEEEADKMIEALNAWKAAKDAEKEERIWTRRS